jgi:hypothetical protein
VKELAAERMTAARDLAAGDEYRQLAHVRIERTYDRGVMQVVDECSWGTFMPAP